MLLFCTVTSDEIVASSSDVAACSVTSEEVAASSSAEVALSSSGEVAVQVYGFGN